MNSEDRLNLQKMINANDVEDQTDIIREKKHSTKIEEDVKSMVFLKNKYQRLSKSNPIEQQFLVVLKKIENNEVNQHEGSFMVGKLLKELYIDSALKKSEKLDAAEEQRNKKKNKSEKKLSKPREISWSEYKNKGIEGDTVASLIS